MEQRRIEIPYAPREWAKELHSSDKRWNVIVAHRRCGKSLASLNHIQRDALRKNDSRYAYISPTYKQSKNIAWDIIKQYSKVIPGVKYNESELRVDYPNGSRITLYGADNPDSLRGIGLNGVIFDEYSQQPSNIFSEIILPALADKKGYAIWIGTPKGKNAFYRLYEGVDDKGRPKDNLDDWLRLKLTVKDTGIIDEEELAASRTVMTEDEYQQEWFCSFEAAIKGAYYAKELSEMREQGRITNVPYEPTVPVNTWWDLGVGDSTTIGFFQDVGKETRMIDYYEASGEGLNHYIQILKDKNYLYGDHYAPHDIEVRELGSGKSRKEIAKSLGVDFRKTPNIPIDDGINAARLKLRTMWIDENKCAQFIDAISQYRKEWNEKMGDFKNRPLHDWTSHAADMLRYHAVTRHRSPNQERVTQYRPSWS